MSKTWNRWITAATIVVVIAALVIMAHLLQQFTWQRIIASLNRIGSRQLGLAALYTAGSYLTLTGFDLMGTRYAGSKIAYPRVALTSFLSLSIGHTVGLAPFSSGAIRYRYYSKWGLDARQVGMVILFSALTVAIGEMALSAFSLLAFPDLAQKILRLDLAITMAIGGVIVTALSAYVVLCARLTRPLKLFKWSINLPGWRLALAQIVVGMVNFLLVASALHALLAADAPIGFIVVATAYILGNLAALLTHVPGGVGVLEATIVLLLPGTDVIGPLIAFRIIYFLVPLAIGLVTLATTELLSRLPARKSQNPQQA